MPASDSITAIFPEGGSSPWPSSLEPGAARFKLFDAAASLLARHSAANPTTIIVEDIQWADRSSLQMLAFVANHPGIKGLLIVVTQREEGEESDALTEVLGGLMRQPAFIRVDLPGISAEETHRLVSAVSGNALGREEAATIFRRAEGNPFFTIEIVRDIVSNPDRSAETGVPGTGRNRGEVPRTVQQAVSRRLARLSPECRTLLRAASVIGRDFSLPTILMINPRDTAVGVAELLAEATKAGFVKESSQEPGSLRFTHALVQETLRAAFTVPTRARLHATFAVALEKSLGNQADAHASRLARHYREAVSIVGAVKAIRYLRIAAEQALASHAYPEAADLFQGALDLVGAGEMNPERAALLFGAGRARAGFLPLRLVAHARADLVKVFDFYRTKDEWEEAAVVALSMPTLPEGDGIVLDAVERAASALPEEGLKAELLMKQAVMIAAERNDFKVANDALKRAIVLAQRLEHPALMLLARLVAGQLATFELSFDDATIEAAGDVVQDAGQLQLPWIELQARYTLGPFLTSHGRLEDAVANSDAMSVLAERYRNSEWIERATSTAWTAASCKGDMKVAMAQVSSRAATEQPYWSALAAVSACQSGGEGQCDQLLNEALEGLKAIPKPRRRFLDVAVPAAIAVCALASDTRTSRLDHAEQLARHTVGLKSTYPLRRLIGWQTLGAIAVVRRDSGAAKEALIALEGMPRFIGNFPFVEVDRLRGLLALTCGEFEPAQRLLESSVSFLRESGYDAELALACHDLASLLVRRDSKVNTDPALRLVREGLAIARAHDLRLASSRLAVLRRMLVATGRGRDPLPAGLTPAEVKILQLVASGKTNREIAGAVSVTLPTVATHLRNILSKLGASNRTEAAARAIELQIPGVAKTRQTG